MHRIIPTLAILTISLSLQAYNHRDINVRHISVEQGLSHYTVNSIYQDEFGFIWVGTMDGLNRYDGHRVKVYKPSRKEPSGIRENNIREICGDGRGHLFVKGLNSLSEFDMRTGTFRMLKEDGVRDIAHDGSRLWIAGGGGAKNRE